MTTRSLGPPPRSWLLDADDRDNEKDGWRDSPFGERDEELIEWGPATTAQEQADLAAAKVHHRLSQSIRSLMGRRGRKIEDIAREISMTPDHLGRILNGSAHISLIDVVRIASALDRDLRVVFREREPEPREHPDRR